jgi:hypothetical protein
MPMRPFAGGAWAPSIIDGCIKPRHLGAFELQQQRESKAAGCLGIVMQLSHEGFPVPSGDDGNAGQMLRTVINRMMAYFWIAPGGLARIASASA